ncbi:MAG: hypothetical protein ACI83N_001019 [Hydrogenophaga sp.]|jgi:hypothetical protein
MNIFNHILATDTSPQRRVFYHTSGRFQMTGGKRVVTRAQAPVVTGLSARKVGRSSQIQRSIYQLVILNHFKNIDLAFAAPYYLATFVYGVNPHMAARSRSALRPTGRRLECTPDLCTRKAQGPNWSQTMSPSTTAIRQQTQRLIGSLKATLSDTYQGFVATTHNSAAVLGALLTVVLVSLSFNADWRTAGEQKLLGWLMDRQEALAAVSDDASDPAVLAFEPEPTAADRVTAALPSELPKQQASVALWLSRKYRVAPEPLGALVAEAFQIGEKARLDPTLILAIMAIESRFNPFAQSPVGAQGLMQVLTRVHTDKYESFGGKLAAFDPLTNLRVGVKVLQDCIKRAGSIEGGLRLYVGAVTTDGNWYVDRVIAEHLRIQSVALGKPMPTSFPKATAIPVAAPAEAAPAAPTAPAPGDAAIEAEVSKPLATGAEVPMLQS